MVNPRKGVNGRGHRKVRPGASTLSPRPVVIVPPRDPPTISASKARVAQIFYPQPISGTLSETTVTAAELEGRIRAQYYGSTTATFFYQIISVFAYASGSATGDIAIRDKASGVTAVDSGSFADRGKVGIMYPPVAQTIRPSGDTGASGQLWVIKAPTSEEVDLYAKIRFWDAPVVEIAPPGLSQPKAPKKQGRITPSNRQEEIVAIKASDLLGY